MKRNEDKRRSRKNRKRVKKSELNASYDILNDDVWVYIVNVCELTAVCIFVNDIVNQYRSCLMV